MELQHPTPEALAKAAVLNFLRASWRLADDAAIASELDLRSAARRADLVVTGPTLLGVEIKTAADSLKRLDQQSATFASAFPHSYVALASKHLKRGFTLVPKGVGIIELVQERNDLSAREVRRPGRHRLHEARTQLSLLPVTALRSLVRESGKGKVAGAMRAELVEIASKISQATRVEFVARHLRERYGYSSDRFRAATQDRPIQAEDIRLLRVWTSRPSGAIEIDPDTAFFTALAERYGRHALGEVPADLHSHEPA